MARRAKERVKRQPKKSVGEMDPQVWSRMPQDLLLQVLAWVPVLSLFRLRLVCRDWKGLIYTPLFLEMCSRVPTREIIGVLCSHFETLKYHSCTRILEFTEGPPPFTGNRVKKARICPRTYWKVLGFLPSTSLQLEVAKGGLLCFSEVKKTGQDNEGRDIVTMRWIVCNPMTNAWRELPPKQGVSGSCLLRMNVFNSFNYNVIICFPSRQVWQEYDSTSQCWSEGQPAHRRQYPVRNYFLATTLAHPGLELRFDACP